MQAIKVPERAQMVPKIEQSVRLNFVGDWGQGTMHRMCAWLCQEFCDRAGPESRVAIWNLAKGGADALYAVHDGEADLCIVTPAMELKSAVNGTGVFAQAMPSLRALAVVPQDDRMIFALSPAFGVGSFAELRTKRPPVRIAVSVNDGFSLLGSAAVRLLAAHGLDRDTIRSWGGDIIERRRPEDCFPLIASGGADAIVQEAVLAPMWHDAVESGLLIPLASEVEALAALEREHGWPRNDIPANYFANIDTPLDALDFSDFVVVVRDDMADDVAHLLTWCLVETRGVIERQFAHVRVKHSPITYPMQPKRMAASPIELHPGARRYYGAAGLI